MAFYRQPKPKYNMLAADAAAATVHGYDRLSSAQVPSPNTSYNTTKRQPCGRALIRCRCPSDPPLRAGAGHTLLHGRGGVGPLEEAVQCLLLL